MRKAKGIGSLRGPFALGAFRGTLGLYRDIIWGFLGVLFGVLSARGGRHLWNYVEERGERISRREG